ncbi:Gfo/Idh/MocA family oxidoreductase [Bradyrhizobium prioriisuperbiae]|uniref:Gfo/Idh/MocA family protein n=1 Tax=Bradyrhizobium prioriisuperbiae TaxID=2854389 RepID=UPI0028EE5295|nr:Gfo/Idh/MocA family oxidoreductase [Bradyrhizobium prioritasuperba]
MTKLRFAAIGINHAHIHGQIDCLVRAGADLVGFHAPEDDLAKAFAERYPQAPRAADRRRLLEDSGISLIVSAGIPADRAPLGIEVMRHGKDYMSDKPGMTSLQQLAEVRRVQAETGRIYSVCYSEHFETRSTVKAGELVAAGAIGRVINTTGLGPHKLKNLPRPDWFYRRERTGGILTDIASHQCEQFLFFADALDAEVVAATVANRANPETPELQDFGELLLRAGDTTGYVRVDWFTPDGLPIWGDGRLTILGTEGTLELRKYIDIAGQPGIDHLFLVDRKGTQRIDCSDVELPYGRQLIADIRDRTETAMPQARCFKAMELALTGQAMAELKQ